MKKSDATSVDKITGSIKTKLDAMMDEISQTNCNAKNNWSILINKYKIKETEQQILYNNIEKIVDVAISVGQIPKTEHKIVGSTWCVIVSEYLKDTILKLDKTYTPNTKIKNLPIQLITEKEAKNYFNKLLKMYDLNKDESLQRVYNSK